jgi:hypothetical protein
VPAGFLRAVHLRGIPVYITGVTSGSSADLLTAGYDGFTVQTVTEASKYVRSLSASVDAGGRLSARIIYFDGTSLDVTALCELLPVSGDVSMRAGVISGEGSYAVTCPQTAQNGEKYYVCSNAMKTGHTAETATEPPAEEADGDSDNFIIITLAAAGAVVVGGLILFAAVLLRGKRKEKQENDPKAYEKESL